MAAIGGSVVLMKFALKDSKGGAVLGIGGSSNYSEATLSFNPMNWFLCRKVGRILEKGIKGIKSFKEFATENVYLSGGFVGGVAVGIAYS